MANAKSKMAFQFNVQSMKTELFFWTFTFAEVLDIVEARARWRKFCGHPHDGLCVCFPNMSGLRVFEIHPGGIMGHSHGLHIHMVCDTFLSVDVVRSIWNKFGKGRIHVKKVPQEAALYLGKYLGKAREECLKGVRLWAPIGRAATHKVSDIVVDTRWTAAYQFLASCIDGFSKLAWTDRVALATRFTFGQSIADSMQPPRSASREMNDFETAEQEAAYAKDPMYDTSNDEHWQDA